MGKYSLFGASVPLSAQNTRRVWPRRTVIALNYDMYSFNHPRDGDPDRLHDVLLPGGGERFRLYPAGDAAARDGRGGDDSGIRNAARRIQRPGNEAPEPTANGYWLTVEPLRTHSLLA